MQGLHWLISSRPDSTGPLLQRRHRSLEASHSALPAVFLFSCSRPRRRHHRRRQCGCIARFVVFVVLDRSRSAVWSRPVRPGLRFAICGLRSAVCVGLFRGLHSHAQVPPAQSSPSFLPSGTPLTTSPPPLATVRLPRHALSPTLFHSPPPPSPSTLAALIPAAHHGFVCLTASARVAWSVYGLLTTCFPASRIGSVFRSFWHTMTSDDRREQAVRKPTAGVAVC